MKKQNEEKISAILFREEPELLTIPDLQRLLGISRRVAYELIREGKLKCFQIGNSYRIPKVFLLNYISMLFLEEEKRMSDKET
ncbi:MAG: helix-turn-helix domain-containing protein [Clostridia bacterium]|nr:helix-turn-helix domain-containing protein [Oscillospiraceae bacterium]MBQ3531650.1 helix-turn-helix domain-containing protein [Oscillospiraceae bacterium]MBQ7014741.1 helix-turn-helix domain-containing protein [Clostridia bacterium]